MTNLQLSVEKEQYVFHPKFPNYSISSYGRVFSLKNKKFLKGVIHNEKSTGKPKHKALTLPLPERKTLHRTIHTLVADIWLPPKPSPEHTIDHIDRNPLNNHYKNLRWATVKEQVLNKNTRRKKIKKLSTEDIETIYQRSKTEFLDGIAAEYGLTKSIVSMILRHVHPIY